MNLPDELQFIINSRKKQKSTKARMDNKVCVITGATSGIGYFTAERFIRGGAKVVIICRNPAKAGQVQKDFQRQYGATIDYFIADFKHLDQVREAANKVAKAYPKVNVLVNNAGIFNKKRKLTPDGNEAIFQVIHLAPFLLTSLLLPNLKAGTPARILDVSSEGHRFGGLNMNDLAWRKRPYIALRAYASAEIAQLHTMRELDRRLAGSGVTINAVHPGAVRTNIGMNNGFLYRFYNRHILRWFLKDPHTSAEAIYYLAAAPEMGAVSGKFFNLTIEENPASYVMKPEASKKIWSISEDLTREYPEKEEK